MFLLGGIVVVASTFRLAYTMLVKNLDPSFDLIVIELWSIIEIIVAIAAACLLTMRPLLKHFIPSFVMSAYSRRSNGTGPRQASGGPAGSGGKHRSWYTPRHTLYNRRKGSSAQDGTLIEDGGLDMDGLYVGNAKGRHAVSTRITAAQRDPYAIDDYGPIDEYKGIDSIKVTQEGPTYTVEGRQGSASQSSDGQTGSVTDVEQGRADAESEKNASTKDLWTKE